MSNTYQPNLRNVIIATTPYLNATYGAPGACVLVQVHYQCEHNGTGWFEGSPADLADLTGFTPAACRNQLNKLIEKGAVEKERRVTTHGDRKARYRVLVEVNQFGQHPAKRAVAEISNPDPDPAVQAVAEISNPGDEISNPGGDEISNPSYLNTKGLNPPQTPSADQSDPATEVGEGIGKLKGTRADGSNPRATGSNPRAKGTSPRQTETSPRASTCLAEELERLLLNHPAAGIRTLARSALADEPGLVNKLWRRHAAGSDPGLVLAHFVRANETIGDVRSPGGYLAKELKSAMIFASRSLAEVVGRIEPGGEA